MPEMVFWRPRLRPPFLPEQVYPNTMILGCALCEPPLFFDPELVGGSQRRPPLARHSVHAQQYPCAHVAKLFS